MVHTVGSFDAISGKSRNDFRETDPRIQSARLKLNQKDPRTCLNTELSG